jgi:uncharacterized protein YraI
MRKLLICAAVVTALSSAAIPAKAAVVCRLDPYGDNFLSLRSGPGGRFPEIDRLGPGTGVSIFTSAGPWLNVRTADGQIGWVHGNYVCGR